MSPTMSFGCLVRSNILPVISIETGYPTEITEINSHVKTSSSSLDTTEDTAGDAG
jgi:hypothetical protein